MSVNLSIKDVPDDIAQRLRERAARNHRSLQGELMAIVEQAASEPPATERATARVAAPRRPVERIAEDARRRFSGAQESSVDLIREMRDHRYGMGHDPASGR